MKETCSRCQNPLEKPKTRGNPVCLKCQRDRELERYRQKKLAKNIANMLK